MKIQQILSSLSLSDAQIYLRDEPFSSEVVIVNLYPTKASHWLVYINENFSRSYGCSSPKKLSKFIIQPNGYCLFSENKIQNLTSKRYSFCAACCFYKHYLTKVSGLDLENCFKFVLSDDTKTSTFSLKLMTLRKNENNMN